MGVSIAVLGLIFYYHYFSGLNLIIKLLLWTFLLLIFLISFSLFITPQEAIVSILEANGRNLTFTGRSLLWVKALYALPDHLLFGYGFDNLQALTERQYKQLINMAHLHNGYLEVLLKGGLIGFFLLMFNIVKTVYYQLKLRKNNKVVFIFLNTGLMMVLFHNFTESSLLKGSMTMDIVFIFIIVLTNLLNQKYQ